MQGDCGGKSCNLSGETGIRTRDTLLTYTRFPDVQPPAIPLLIFNTLQIATISFALILRFFIPICVIKLAFARQQPPRRYPVVGHHEGQP